MVKKQISIDLHHNNPMEATALLNKAMAPQPATERRRATVLMVPHRHNSHITVRHNPVMVRTCRTT